jgi:hypothetical protein
MKIKKEMGVGMYVGLFGSGQAVYLLCTIFDAVKSEPSVMIRSRTSRRVNSPTLEVEL